MAGGSLPAVKVREHLPEVVALETEAALISAIGRQVDGGPLVNLTIGGNGGISGYSHTHEARRNIGAPKIGKPRSAETRAKISASKTGVRHSAVSRANMSAGQKNRPVKSAVERAGISARQLGVPRSAETKARISIRRLELKISPTPEARAKMSESQKHRAPRTAETLAKMSAGCVLREARKRAAKLAKVDALMPSTIAERPTAA
jgi:hypothetical protein